MDRDAAFAELLARHEELTSRFAKLLHDDAGQVLTAIALRLSALESPADIKELQTILDDLLERFRQAQASLGAAVIPNRGLLAGLSQRARQSGTLKVIGDQAPQWPLEASRAAFRIIEALAPKQVQTSAGELTLSGAGPNTPYTEALAAVAKLSLQAGPGANTIRIKHAHSGSHR